MSLAKNTQLALNKNVKDVNSTRIDNLIRRVDKFDDVKPRETVWSEQRLLDTVRTHVWNEIGD